MELRHLRYFLAVAEEKNFTRAAERLGIGQPPLSQQIRALETEVGTLLFHRLPHGAELTESGKAFLDPARAAIAAAERARLSAQRAARGEIGMLRVGFTGSGAFTPLVPSLIRAFRRAYPDVEVELLELNSEKLMARLAREEVDIAFLRPALADPEGLRLLRFPDEPMVAALPALHPLAEHDRIALADLAEQPFVFYPRTIGLGLYDEVYRACQRAGFSPRLVQEAPQIASVVNLVAAEMGVSIVPRSMSQVRVPGVVFRDFAGDAPVARHACAMRRAETAPAARNFWAMVAAARPQV